MPLTRCAFFTLLRCLCFLMPSLAFSETTVIPLWPEGVPGLREDASPENVDGEYVSNIHTPTLTVHRPPAGSAHGTAVILCPGGGYRRFALQKEGTEIAAWFNARGVTAFVLKSRLAEYGQPAPLRDVLRAIRLVRSRAADFSLNAGRIGVMGFSAGGHLASCAATLYDAPEGKTGAALDSINARPDFAILIYPVITMGEFAHTGSRAALLGKNPSPALIERFSTEQQVTAETPPAFIFHTTEDGSVPVENALAFYSALRRHKVPAELHVFERGPHGMGMRPGHGPASDWPILLESWLRIHDWMPAR